MNYYASNPHSGYSLIHYGILGMKWGVRRYQNADGSYTAEGRRRYGVSDKTYSTTAKNGKTVTLVPKKQPLIAKGLGKISPTIREKQSRMLDFDTIVDGKKVGNFSMNRDNPDTMNVVWGDTKKKERGKGYMQAALRLGEQVALDAGAKKLTGELVGNSPDIHRVTEKLGGYKKVGEIRTKEVLDMWGGLTLVEKDLRAFVRTPEQEAHHRIFTKSEGGSYASNDAVFVSGKIKFDEPVPPTVKRELDKAIAAKSKILIGDAPGADTRVQDYLSDRNYKNVVVYTTDDTVRNNVGSWAVKKIGSDGHSDEREIRRQKDIAMTNAATKGFVISSDDDRSESATSLNVQRLNDSGKEVQFYDYKQDELRTNMHNRR